MKNKKLLMRLFALLASLVLVLALAIPCFADDATVTEETPAPTQLVLTEYYFLDYADFFHAISYGQVPAFLFPVAGSNIMLNLQFSTVISNNNGFVVSVVYVNSTYVLPATMDTYVVFTENGATMIINNRVTEPNQTEYTLEELDVLVTSSSFWVYEPLQLPEIPDTPDEPTEPSAPIEPEAGWYGQVKAIIKNAVFGENTLLNEAQQFTLDQISMWLTLFVILLPLIVGAVILVRCFR